MSIGAFEKGYQHHGCEEHSDLRPMLWCGSRTIHRSHHWEQQQSSIMFDPMVSMYCKGTTTEEVPA